MAVRRPARDCNEATLQRAVIRLLLSHGYRYMHIPKSFTRGKWQTVAVGDPGWPDLIAFHPATNDHLLIELKSAKGRLREGQQDWIDSAGPEHGYVIRPGDWDALLTRIEEGSQRGQDEGTFPEENQAG